jgi:hypothetical protein
MAVRPVCGRPCTPCAGWRKSLIHLFLKDIFRDGRPDRLSQEASSHDHGMAGAPEFDEVLGVFNTNRSIPNR